MNRESTYDVLVVGGGPAGLSAALTLGRARKRVLLADAGPRRNAAATHIHNFVTRDGTPPDEFRRIAREQLAQYPNVEVRDASVTSITGAKGAFHAELGSDAIDARRVLLAVGMVDEMLPIEGLRELWGRSIFQCPYCHGWEVRERAWGFLARDVQAPHTLMFATRLRAWTDDVTVFTNGADFADDVRAQLTAAGVKIVTTPVSRLVARDGSLEAVALAGGSTVACEALFVHPPQHQVALVGALDLALDEERYVRVDPMTRETSRPGVYAAGDLTTRMQGAVLAAASAVQAATMIDVELTMELARSGAR